MLDIKGVKKSYGEFQLDCSLNVEKGRITGLVGENGCLLYTSDAADEEDSVDLGGRRIINKKTE